MSLTINRVDKPYNGPSPDTLRALETVPEIYLILSPELYILTASDLYIKATETTRETIVGKHIFEAFPDNPALPEADGVKNINASLQEVLKTKMPHYMPVQRYDVPDLNIPGKFIQRYWDPSHTPVLNERGEILYIIQKANNVTEQVLAEIALAKIKAEQDEALAQMKVLNEELAASSEEINLVNLELKHTQESLLHLNAELEQRIASRTAELSEREGELRMALDQQVNAKKELAHTNERLNIALDAGALGYTEVDLKTGAMNCNDQFKSCYGRHKDEKFTYSDLFEAILPQYRDSVKSRVSFAKENNSLYKAVYEVAWPDGTIHWISAHGRPRYGKDGKADRMVGIISDITEQKMAEQRKNDFITMVSHELKTPLTSLSAYIQMLSRRAEKESDAFGYGALEKSIMLIKKMSNMINGFLNVSRLESGNLHINKENFDMAAVIKETEEEAAATIASHKVLFSPIMEAWVCADRDKIGHVINNFITNSVKYSKPDSTINVACIIVNDRVQVSVRDEGMGIAPENVEKLFNRYYRVEKASTVSGFGIGLYLCAEIIHHHNGKIWVESEVGKGSTFYFNLPLPTTA